MMLHSGIIDQLNIILLAIIGRIVDEWKERQLLMINLFKYRIMADILIISSIRTLNYSLIK
jgi:hypothetical protein